MKKLITFALIAISSVCNATEIKKTIQVSATIVPYCVFTYKDGESKYVCRGYEGQEQTVSRYTIKKEGNITTLYY